MGVLKVTLDRGLRGAGAYVVLDTSLASWVEMGGLTACVSWWMMLGRESLRGSARLRFFGKSRLMMSLRRLFDGWTVIGGLRIGAKDRIDLTLPHRLFSHEQDPASLYLVAFLL